MSYMQSRKVLERAWRNIQENARTSTSLDVKAEVEQFAEDATGNLIGLSNQLSRRTFKFPKAKGIPIAKTNADGTKSKTKFRPIVLAPLKSRIVQRAILEALGTVADLKPFAENPHSFGGIRKHADGLAAVPAAVQAVLHAIGSGATHVAFADITAFFTKIPKADVIEIVAKATNDPGFVALFTDGITCELENMAELKEKAKDFPIEAIGVAQGNSLSPLLGNILLHDFDREMNKGDCVCIRYIDDFIILAPSAKAAKARLKVAKSLLAKFGMELSEQKTSAAPIPVTQKFNFLGIEFSNGLIRPSQGAIAKLEENIRKRLNESAHSMRTTKKGDLIPKRHSLVATLNRVDGIIRGWGKHYRFCNDAALLGRVDARMQTLLKGYLGQYRAIKDKRAEADASSLLGVDELSRQARKPFSWPKKAEAANLKIEAAPFVAESCSGNAEPRPKLIAAG